jgi:colicin import membrane protein
MKAALQAWGSDTNLFHQGFAKETDDPAIVAATLAKPGVVLRRPVGSDGAFSEHAELPKVAKREHETKVEEIKRDRAALDRRSQEEDARWEKQKEKLETALRRARD